MNSASIAASSTGSTTGLMRARRLVLDVLSAIGRLHCVASTGPLGRWRTNVADVLLAVKCSYPRSQKLDVDRRDRRDRQGVIDSRSALWIRGTDE